MRPGRGWSQASPLGPQSLCHCPRAPAPPSGAFPACCLGQDDAPQRTHSRTLIPPLHATRGCGETAQHPSYPPVPGPAARGEGCPGASVGVSSSWPRPSALSRLRGPSSPPPTPANWLPGQPSWEAASYHGNPAWPPGCLAEEGQGTSLATELRDVAGGTGLSRGPSARTERPRCRLCASGRHAPPAWGRSRKPAAQRPHSGLVPPTCPTEFPSPGVRTEQPQAVTQPDPAAPSPLPF